MNTAQSLRETADFIWFSHSSDEYNRIYKLMREAADNGCYQIYLNEDVSNRTIFFLKRHGLVVERSYIEGEDSSFVKEISWWDESQNDET